MDVFLVISVIDPWVETPYSYGKCRSRYSAEERYSQTIGTILSIKNHSASSKIVFVEGGKPTYNESIRKMVDTFVYAAKSSLVKRVVGSQSKAAGEAVLMLCAFPFLWFSGANYFFKISGRYRLNDRFDRARWDVRMITGKSLCDETQISTRLFGFPRKKMLRLLYALLRRIWRLRSGSVYENYLLKGIGRKNIHFISPIGLEGSEGVAKWPINE